jgi:hypothetical protein
MLDHAIAYFAKRPQDLTLEAWNGRPEANAVYSRRAFNAEGDNQAHWTAQAPPGLRRRAGLSGAPPALIVPRLNAFARRVRDAGARAFLSLPPVPPEDLVRQAPNFAFLCSTLRTELDMPLIQPSVQAYPHEMFFDTAYHLSLPGGRRQTREVAARLLAELERQPAVSR